MKESSSSVAESTSSRIWATVMSLSFSWRASSPSTVYSFSKSTWLLALV